MEAELSKYVNVLKPGDRISLVLSGTIVDGTFEELVDNCIIVSDATSPSNKKKQYHLQIPLESIYAWGHQEKKEKKKKKPDASK